MKRVLKWIAVVFVLVLVGIACAVFTVWGYYRHVVNAIPGARALPIAPGPLTSMVNVFAGTGGAPWMGGLSTPAATMPFGMVRLAPDTAGIWTDSVEHSRSGYYYGDNKIIGFSHTRLVGADAFDGGVFRVFPSLESYAARDRRPERTVSFSHAEEAAAPGYYSVNLPDRRVRVELTATPRVGMHRYTFDDAIAEDVHLVFDVSSMLGNRRTENAYASIQPDDREVTGHVKCFGSFSGRYDGLDVYFAARVNAPIAAYGGWQESTFKAGITKVTGHPAGVDLTFARNPAGATTIELRLALSYVSIDNARENLDAEAPAAHTFNDVASAARDAWEGVLNRIRVEGGSETQRHIFYTSLYRAFLMPTIFSDVNGEYKGFDGAIHKAEGFTYYTDFSLWDTCRTVQPLYYLIARDEARDMMVSMVEMAKAGGCLPRWPSGAGYTNCMIGTPADITVSEAYLKGIRDFDVETAYQAMRETGLTGKPEGTRFAGRAGLDRYVELGFVPDDEFERSVALTLEFASEDNSIALLAAALGHTEDAALFAKHARNYENVWDPERQFFVGRNADGTFQRAFHPKKLTYTDSKGKYTRAYVEGSAWQWRWFVPHDPEGLVALFKSPEYFVEQLNEFFENTNDDVGHWYPGSYYWHGNEPDIHASYLFNAAGRPDLTQYWVRHLLDSKYSDDYIGLDGNDDGGTLSAWYVWSALGLYPVAGTTRYELGSLTFDRAIISTGVDRLVIEAMNNAPKNVYVQGVSLDGQRAATRRITHDQLMAASIMQFDMGATPAPLEEERP